MSNPVNTAFFAQFECRTILTQYSQGRLDIIKTVMRLDSAIAGYLIGNRDKPEKLKNLADCRDWLLNVSPSPQDVTAWLTFGLEKDHTSAKLREQSPKALPLIELTK